MNTELHRGSFGAVLRRLRRAAGMSQEDLAERARLSVESIGALERGKRRAPYRETIRMICDALGLSEAERRELEAAAKRARAGVLKAVSYDSGELGASAGVTRQGTDDTHRSLTRPLSTFLGRVESFAGESSAIDLAEARFFAGNALEGVGRSEEGERLIASSIDVYRAQRAKQLAAHGINSLGIIHSNRGDLGAARDLFAEALSLFREVANKRGLSSVAANLAETEFRAGNAQAP